MFQITEYGFIASSFSHRELIDTNKARSGKLLCLVHVATTCLNVSGRDLFKTRLNKAWSDFGGGGNMSHRAIIGLLPKILAVVRRFHPPAVSGLVNTCWHALHRNRRFQTMSSTRWSLKDRSRFFRAR